jgi:O-antigen ligase
LVLWVLIVVGCLWPFIALAGGLGFAPLLGIAAILTLPIGAPRMKLRLYMIAAFAALEFAFASSHWSPRPVEYFDINFLELRFTIKFEVLRLALGLLWAGVLASAAQTLTPQKARLLVRVVTIALLLQLVIVALLAIFEKQALELFAPLMPNSGEGVQNISRNGIIMALAAPLLIVGMGWSLSFSRALVVEVVVFLAVTAVLLTRGVHGGIVSIVAGLLAVAIVRLFPRYGFRILGVILAFTVVATPLIFGFISRGSDATAPTNSADWRLAIWGRVVEVVREDPFFGQGVGVLRTIDERIPSGVFAGDLLVPNHAHNMVLQLWAETGAIGASLVAIAILTAGFRMPQPRMLGVAGFLAAALAGQFMAIGLVSFDLWNDWWWAAAAFLASFIVVVYRAGMIDQPGRQLAAPAE